MATSPFETADCYNFFWKIRNGSLCSLRPCDWIAGPLLRLNYPLSEWIFYLRYARNESSEDYLAIYLQRNFDEGPQSVQIVLTDLELTGISSDTKIERLEKCFKKGDSYEILRSIRKPDGNILYTLYPSKDILEFTCTLASILDTAECNELKQFSDDMKELFLSENFSDTVLRSGDVELNVHRAILEARSGGLKILEKNCNQNILHLTIPATEESAFRDLLLFLYSAQMTNSVSRKKLVATAKTLGMKNLYEEYLEVPSCWKAETLLRRKRKCIRVNINEMNDKTDIRSFCLLGIPWRFVFDFSKNHKTEQVSICLSHREPGNLSLDVPSVNIRVILIMEDFCGRVLGRKTRYWNVKNGSDKSLELSMKYKKKQRKSNKSPTPLRTFFFILDIWHGKESSKMTYVGTSRRNLLSDIMLLGKDLYRLLEREMLADLTILVPDGRLNAHRAILSARSPVLKKLLEQNIDANEKGELFIETFKKNVVDLFLQHIYGIPVVFPNTETVIYLAFASQMYSLETLKERCFVYLVDTLDITSAIYVYVLFDYLKQEEYKNVTKQYIRGNICLFCEQALVAEFRDLDYKLYLEALGDTKCICRPKLSVSSQTDPAENESLESHRPILTALHHMKHRSSVDPPAESSSTDLKC